MRMLFKLTNNSSGRLLLHSSCLGLCYLLNKPSKRARAYFHWRGIKRELRFAKASEQRNRFRDFRS